MLKLSNGSCMLRLGLRLSIGSCMLRLGLRLRLSFRGSGWPPLPLKLSLSLSPSLSTHDPMLSLRPSLSMHELSLSMPEPMLSLSMPILATTSVLSQRDGFRQPYSNFSNRPHPRAQNRGTILMGTAVWRVAEKAKIAIWVGRPPPPGGNPLPNRPPPLGGVNPPSQDRPTAAAATG